MKLPKNHKERIAALILIGLFGSVVVSAVVSMFFDSKKQTLFPIEQVLWVTDWEIGHIYGPGTPEQQQIVKQLGDHLEFKTPVLYRMGGSSAGNPSEGILLFGFDPNHPEMAKALAAKHEPK